MLLGSIRVFSFLYIERSSIKRRECGALQEKMIKFFYESMTLLNILKLVLINLFSKQAFSFCSFIEVIRINLIKLYIKATVVLSFFGCKLHGNNEYSRNAVINIQKY